ncbi:hypothetical protein ACFVWR_16980 [Leifsonia sp. NPDC058292]|uniref:hypothetical protein n=1 Tax=Leifsonia sp. NPDC058292 TaxID=3346428 RepID=UPI0036DF836B
MPGSPVPPAADGPATRSATGPTTGPGLIERTAPAGRRTVWSHWWVRVFAVYAASRVVTTTFLLVLASVQGPNPWTLAHPGLFDYSSIWDGRWYNIVSISGYPATLPFTDGHVTENAWAFLPAYPGLVNVLQFVTRMPWPVVAVLVSVGFGAGAALVFYRLLRRVRLSPSVSLFAVTLFCVSPVSPLFQLAYAESMYIFLLVLALYLLVERRYALLFPVVLVMAFTRPSGLAFALALVFHVVYRWVRRGSDPFPMRERVLSVSLAVFSGLAGLAWPAIAGAVTGDLTAYTDTELAWRSSYIGFTDLVPFASWFQGANWWFGSMLGVPGWLGIVVLLILIALFCLAMFSPAVKRLGVDLRFWVAAYATYLLAVFFPQSSTFRLLMPLFPLLGAIALPRGRVYRSALVVVFLALQVGWLLVCWGVDGADWSPP